MRLSYLIGSIVAMEACKCSLLILLIPYYPMDLTRWIASLYPPWQNLQTPAPYGLPWYILYSPGLLGFPILAMYQAIAETLTLVYLVRRQHLFIAGAFALTSGMVFFWDPFDLWSYLLILLSVKWRPLLAASVLVKIPLGAPSWVWQFIIGASLQTHGNYPHYVILGGWWLAMLWYVTGMTARSRIILQTADQLIAKSIPELRFWRFWSNIPGSRRAVLANMTIMSPAIPAIVFLATHRYVM
jgi:hypothetical protein